MTVLELALIDIRNFKEVKKLILKPGFNIIQGSNGSGKTTLFTVLSDLFFPSYGNYSPTRTSQAAVLFRMNNGEIYRLLRNFSKQTAQLYQLDATKKLALIAKESGEIQNRLISILKLDELPKEKVSSFFFLNRTPLPSYRPIPIKKSESGAMASLVPVENQPGRKKIEERLNELKKQAAQSDRIAQIESNMLDYKDKAYSIKRILNEFASIETELSEIADKEKAVPGFISIPQDIHSIMEDYEKNLQEKNSEEQQLLEEKEIIEQQLIMEQQPLIQNKFLWAGAGLVLIAILIAILLPIFIEVEGVIKQLDLLGLVIGIGLMLYALIGDFRRISRRKIWKEKLEHKNKNLEMLNARFQRENARYFDVLAKTESPDAKTLEAKLSAFQRLKEEEQSLILKKQNALAGKDKSTLESDLKEANEKAGALEKEINQLKPGTADPYVIQNEIKTLEEKLMADQSVTSLDAAIGNSPLDNDFRPALSISSFLQTDWPFILKISQLNPEQINQLIQKRFSVFGNDFMIQINEEGTVTLNKELDTLSPGTLDQLFLFLFILRTELLKEIPLPLLVDDPLMAVDPSRQSAILNYLKDLAKTRQIVLFSNTLYPVENANVIRL